MPDSQSSNRTQKVIHLLDLAIQAAEEAEMSTVEIVGLLHYYAHNLAQEARESTVDLVDSEK